MKLPYFLLRVAASGAVGYAFMRLAGLVTHMYHIPDVAGLCGVLLVLWVTHAAAPPLKA